MIASSPIMFNATKVATTLLVLYTRLLTVVNFVSSTNSFGLARQKLSVFFAVIALFADSRLNINVDSGVNLNVKWISRNYNNRAHTCAKYAVKLNHP